MRGPLDQRGRGGESSRRRKGLLCVYNTYRRGEERRGGGRGREREEDGGGREKEGEW